MATENREKKAPKGKVKFNITLSEEQKASKTEILEHPYNFILGKAGSGKTLLAVQIALDMFFQRKINQIIITRPTVSNEDNGYLPGSLNEKMEPWLVPIRSNMRKVYNKPAILGKGSTMILCGDPQQIDLKFANDSAIHEVPKVKESKYVYSVNLLDNHRHESLNEILRLLQNYG